MKTIREVYGISESCIGRVDFDGVSVTPNPDGKFVTSQTGRINRF